MSTTRQKYGCIKKGCLLSFGFFLFFMFMFGWFIWARNHTVYGLAESYQQLKNIKGLQRFLEFFPPSGKHFDYWYMPLWGCASGSCEIAEEDFIQWAHSKGWKLTDARLANGCIQYCKPDTSEFISPKEGLWYREIEYREPELNEPHERKIYRILQIYYDRAGKKVYFSRM